MSSTSKLEGCSRRYLHQLTKLKALMDVVEKPIKDSGNREVLQTLGEMVIVTVVAYLEEFLNCVVGVGAALREQEFREFLAMQGSELEKPIARTGVPRIQWRLRHRRFSPASNCSGLMPPR